MLINHSLVFMISFYSGYESAAKTIKVRKQVLAI